MKHYIALCGESALERRIELCRKTEYAMIEFNPFPANVEIMVSS